MKKKKITEKEHFENCWYKDAEKQTLETLPLFMNHVLNDYQHDYGTICKAIAACGAGAMHAAIKTTHDYISGFQASIINGEVLKAWGGIKTHTCAKIINFDDMVFPHNQHRFANTISKETWDSVQEYAKSRLSEADNFGFHPKVKAHLESIVAGNIPFGYIIKSNE